MVVSYISGLVDDEDEEVDDIVEMTRGMLQGGPSNADSNALDDLSVKDETLQNAVRLTRSQYEPTGCLPRNSIVKASPTLDTGHPSRKGGADEDAGHVGNAGHDRPS